ncbi:retrovirus-related pol polyprotein from transposon TNT 1-94 [Tanacetum coccineum]
MHNNIMAAGSRDRPPMLALGRYAQWRSRFMRYIDTKENYEALKKYLTEGPYVPSIVIIPAQPARRTSELVAEHSEIETLTNMFAGNKAHFKVEKEAIHMLLIGIRDVIYSTVDACKITHEMWIAIERLQHGESLNVQDVKTNLFWEFGRFTSRDGESMESYYSRFYKMINEMYQKEVNKLRAEKIAKNVNLLALVAAAQQYPDPYYQAPKPQRSYAPVPKQQSSTSFNKDKEMQKNLALNAKYFKKLYKPTNNNLRTSSNSRNKNVDTSPRYVKDNKTGQFVNQRTVTVAGARETVGSQVVQQTGIQCYNYKEFGHLAKECRKLKRAKDYTYHNEKMLLCKQAEKGVPLQAEQADWLEDTDKEIDEQELEAHYNFMAKIQKVLPADSGTDAKPL